MSTRTSTRQAAVKANQAFSHGAGTKRKVSVSKQSPQKKGKPDARSHKGKHYKQPSVADEAQEPQATGSQRETKALNSAGTDGKAAHTKARSAIKESPEREDAIPSSILEKGIIYFFFRPRVNVDDPHSLKDVARSFFVLRPTPKGTHIERGPLGDDAANCRLLMLPKKKFPTSGRERDMAFVEKAQVSLKTIRDSLMTEETYETKTQGERTTPASRPYAEGVYALIKDGKHSHLAYILTVPQEFKDVQSDFGLHGRGSFIVQSKNPEYPGPASARLPQKPEYPKKVLERFQSYRWIPTEPELINYSNAQILMIGVAHDHLGKAGEAHTDDKGTKIDPAMELDQLEGENEERAKSLSGDHAIFEDLGVDAAKYESLASKWE